MEIDHGAKGIELIAGDFDGDVEVVAVKGFGAAAGETEGMRGGEVGLNFDGEDGVLPQTE